MSSRTRIVAISTGLLMFLGAVLCGSGLGPALAAPAVGVAWTRAAVANDICAFEVAETVRLDAGGAPTGTASLTARLRLPTDVEPGTVAVLVDQVRHRGSPRTPDRVRIDGLAAGQHRLLACWWTSEPRLQIVDLQVDLAAREHRDLGELGPAPTPRGSLRVLARRDGIPLSPDELRETGLARARVGVLGGPEKALPFCVVVPVDGLQPQGVGVRAAAADKVRVGGVELWNKDFEAAPQLLPGRLLELSLDYAAKFQVTVDARWMGATVGTGWVEVYVVPRDGASVWARSQGGAAAAIEVAVFPGPALLVVALVDRAGVTRAFRTMPLHVAGPQRLVVDLQPTVPARGTWPDWRPAAGTTVHFALADWPERPLWRAPVRPDGTFALGGLPRSQPLLARLGEGQLRPVVLHEAEDDRVATVEPR